MTRADVLEVLRSLERDRSIWASAPCGHEYRLADSELFYGDELPATAEEFIEEQKAVLDEYKRKVRDLQVKLTEGFTRRSVVVKLGKTVEKICPVLPGFPYQPLDCRALYDPIDYIAFIGASKGAVSHLDFVDVKTGNARLSDVQKEIKDAVDDGKVAFRQLRP